MIYPQRPGTLTPETIDLAVEAFQALPQVKNAHGNNCYIDVWPHNEQDQNFRGEVHKLARQLFNVSRSYDRDSVV